MTLGERSETLGERRTGGTSRRPFSAHFFQRRFPLGGQKVMNKMNVKESRMQDDGDSFITLLCL